MSAEDTYLMYIHGNEVDALCCAFPKLAKPLGKAITGGGLMAVSGICYKFLV